MIAKNSYLLAPMHEINDIAFRLLCKKAGAGLTYTGMLHPKTEQKIYLDDNPGLQIFCTNEKGVKKFIKKYGQASLYDLNLGCPSKIAKKIGFGVYLQSDSKAIERILISMNKATSKPVTVKLRKSEYVIRLLDLFEKYCDAVAIHPRSASQGYKGEVDIDYARWLKKELSIPVIYSGNVNEDNINELGKEFDYIMIGRKAVGNPNFFSDSNKEYDFFDYLELAKKYNLGLEQIKTQAMNFVKGIKDASKFRKRIVKSRSLNRLR